MKSGFHFTDIDRTTRPTTLWK